MTEELTKAERAALAALGWRDRVKEAGARLPDGFGIKLLYSQIDAIYPAEAHAGVRGECPDFGSSTDPCPPGCAAGTCVALGDRRYPREDPMSGISSPDSQEIAEERPMHYGDDDRTACGKFSGMVFQYTAGWANVTCSECIESIKSQPEEPPQWYARTMTDVRPGDTIRPLSQRTTAEAESRVTARCYSVAPARAGQTARDRGSWHVIEGSGGHWDDHVLQPGECCIHLDGAGHRTAGRLGTPREDDHGVSRTLRDYQTEAITYLKTAWSAGVTRPPAVLATGLGKTEIFTDPTLLDEFLNAGNRVLIIAHTDELIEQAARKARRNNPGRRIGIVKATLNQITAQIIVSSRQTLAGENRRAALRNVGLIIIDEAHHALRTNTYGKILEHFGAFTNRELNPVAAAAAPMVAGFTATLVRGDKGKLSTVWQEPAGGVFSRDVLFGIRKGYLLDVRAKRIIVPDMDLRNVKQVGGDYSDSSMAEELERTFAPEVIGKAYLEHAVSERTGELRKGVAFWPLIETAYHAAEAFNRLGIRSEVVHGETAARKLSKSERRAILARLHSGETTVIHSVDALNEGWDDPTVDVAILGGPTRSGVRYRQRAGRVLRPSLEIPAAQREKALLLDAVGAGATHDLRSLIDLAPERTQGVNALDGDSLLEIDDMIYEIEQAAPGDAHTAEDYRGETAVVDYDPLGRDRLWAQTPGGVWHMMAGTVAYVFLVDSVAGEPGHYDVVLTSKPGRGRDAVKAWTKATDYVDLPLDIALAEAEGLALEVGGHGTKTLTGRKSAWRRKPATECKPGFIGIGRSLGVYVDGMTAGELSEAIDAAQASRRIDPIVSRVRQLTSE